MLTQRGLFVPHGTCSHVRVGGHVQTGGYSQLGRAFGLFGDHVDAIELVTADGEVRTVTRGVPADAELFYAVLGGSPGNYGVLTHLHMRPHSDEACKRCGGVSHSGSIGLKVIALYSRSALEAVLTRLAAMSDDPAYPRNIDAAVTVMSAAQVVLPDYDYLAGVSLDEKMKFDNANIFGKDELLGWPASLILALQVRGAVVEGGGGGGLLRRRYAAVEAVPTAMSWIQYRSPLPFTHAVGQRRRQEARLRPAGQTQRIRQGAGRRGRDHSHARRRGTRAHVGDHGAVGHDERARVPSTLRETHVRDGVDAAWRARLGEVGSGPRRRDREWVLQRLPHRRSVPALRRRGVAVPLVRR